MFAYTSKQEISVLNNWDELGRQSCAVLHYQNFVINTRNRICFMVQHNERKNSITNNKLENTFLWCTNKIRISNQNKYFCSTTDSVFIYWLEQEIGFISGGQILTFALLRVFQGETNYLLYNNNSKITLVAHLFLFRLLLDTLRPINIARCSPFVSCCCRKTGGAKKKNMKKKWQKPPIKRKASSKQVTSHWN